VSSANIKPKELVPDAVLLREFNITAMTLWRWDADASLGFPKPIFIRGKKYRLRDQVEKFKTRMVKASGEKGAALTNPPPRRRAKKLEPTGGALT
jgi:hypothetical protein